MSKIGVSAGFYFAAGMHPSTGYVMEPARTALNIIKRTAIILTNVQHSKQRLRVACVTGEGLPDDFGVSMSSGPDTVSVLSGYEDSPRTHPDLSVTFIYETAVDVLSPETEFYRFLDQEVGKAVDTLRASYVQALTGIGCAVNVAVGDEERWLPDSIVFTVSRPGLAITG